VKNQRIEVQIRYYSSSTSSIALGFMNFLVHKFLILILVFMFHSKVTTFSSSTYVFLPIS